MYHVSFEKFLLYNCFFSYETHSFIILSYNVFIYKSFSKVSSVINVISYNAFFFFIVCSFISILYDSFIKKKPYKMRFFAKSFFKSNLFDIWFYNRLSIFYNFLLCKIILYNMFFSTIYKVESGQGKSLTWVGGWKQFPCFVFSFKFTSMDLESAQAAFPLHQAIWDTNFGILIWNNTFYNLYIPWW